MNLLDSDEYILVNGWEKSSKIPFTRYDKSDPLNNEKKLLLDIVIISSDDKKR